MSTRVVTFNGSKIFQSKKVHSSAIRTRKITQPSALEERTQNTITDLNVRANPLTTHFTLVRLRVLMRHEVGAQNLMLRETAAAHLAGVLLLAVVNEHVTLEIGLLVERFVAQTTSVRPQTGMSEHVRFQVVLLRS